MSYRFLDEMASKTPSETLLGSFWPPFGARLWSQSRNYTNFGWTFWASLFEVFFLQRSMEISRKGSGACSGEGLRDGFLPYSSKGLWEAAWEQLGIHSRSTGICVFVNVFFGVGTIWGKVGIP